MKTEEDEMLQRYFDGESSADEDAVVRQMQGAQGHLASLSKLRGYVRANIEENGYTVNSESLYARIQEKISEPTKSAQVVPMRSIKARSRLWIAGASGFAVAAAAIFALMPRPAQNPSVASRGSEVLAVDFGGSSGTVFSIESLTESPVTVVWINDHEL